MSKKKKPVKKVKKKVITKKEEITKWRRHLPLSVVVAICGAFFAVGGLSFRVLNLHHRMETNYSVVREGIGSVKARVAVLQDEAGDVQHKIAVLRSCFSKSE